MTVGPHTGVTHVRGQRVDVVDTVGAGDTFMSALIHGLITLGLDSADARDRLRGVDPMADLIDDSRCCQAGASPKSGIGRRTPPRSADSWAMIPGRVNRAATHAFTLGIEESLTAVTKSSTRKW